MGQFDYTDQGQRSIQIYTYRQDVGHTLMDIEDILKAEPTCSVKLRTPKDSDTSLYANFDFTHVKSDNEKIIYSVHGKRDILNEDPIPIYHDMCFTTQKFLIITGMKHATTLLKCLAEKLHPTRPYRDVMFTRKYLDKTAMQNFTKLFLKSSGNRIYQPRFRSFSGYRDREFNDFRAVKDRCATTDVEYKTLMDNCHYFEPIFKVNKMCGEILQKEVTLRVQHHGYFCNSRNIPFDAWLKFIREYLPWCR